MTLTEAIAELEKQRAICIEIGLDPAEMDVFIPGEDDTWDELSDMKIESLDKIVFDLFLKG